MSSRAEVRFKEVKAALWLVVSCSQTRLLCAARLQSKGQLSLMRRETMTFIQLGHTEVGLYADNEPTMRALLRILLNSRHALGLRTRIYTTRVKDSAGNSLAENAIQRIRGLAGTLMESLMKKVGLRFNSNHALWSWAARHGASFELTQGKSYESPLVPFGCPVYARQRQSEVANGYLFGQDPTIYREADAQAVEEYARSKEGQEEAEREIQEVQLMLGATEEVVSGALAAEGGVPAPRAPPAEGQSSPVPALQHPGEVGSDGFVPMEIPHYRGMTTRALKRREL